MPSTPTICNAEVIPTYQPFSKRDSLKLETCISVLHIPITIHNILQSNIVIHKLKFGK